MYSAVSVFGCPGQEEVNMRTFLKLASIMCISLVLTCGVIMTPRISEATVYLDGSTTACTNGNTKYDPATRSCGSGSDTVYLDLASFQGGIVAATTNYIRAGNYFRDNPNAHQGSLFITQAGKDDANRTIIKAYPGEELKAVIGTAKRGATYNSNPADTSGAGSYYYYPNVVLNIAANYVTVYGLKIYGMTYFYGSNYSIVDSCDLGGGGSAIDVGGQGQVVRFNNTHDCVLRNSKIHNSSNAIDGVANGSAVMWYVTSCIIENNTFYDNWYGDVRNKDGTGQTGRTTEVRYNFFGPSTIYSNKGTGFIGFNQAQYTSNIYVHHNIFYDKYTGIDASGAPLVTPSNYIFYQNTFINNTYGIVEAINNTSNTYKMYNNLFYNTGSGQSYNRTYFLSVLTGSDYNVYYNSGLWQTHDSGAWTTVASSLSAWQSYSKLDANSLSVNPGFVNASGTTPAAFKRISYAENFTGSPYSNRAGAYATGNETIGNPVGFSFIPQGLTIINIIK